MTGMPGTKAQRQVTRAKPGRLEWQTWAEEEGPGEEVWGKSHSPVPLMPAA